jgi:hypothetical protein
MMVLRNVAKIGIIQCDDEAIKNFDPIFRMRERKEKEKERERERGEKRRINVANRDNSFAITR